MKKQKGITLVTLVISIIVLLILTSVSMQIILGDNGLLARANEAKEATEISGEREIISLSLIEAMAKDKGILSEENLRLALEDNSDKGNKASISDFSNLEVTVKFESSRWYKIINNSEIQFIGYEEDIINNFQNLKVGENIFSSNNFTEKKYINPNNGQLVDGNDWNASDYISIDGYNKFIIISDNGYFLSQYNALYDENKNFIKAITIGKTTIYNDKLGGVKASIYILECNENEKYIRISAENDILKHIKIFPILNENFNGVFNFDISDIDYKFENNMFDGSIVKDTYIFSTNGKETKYNGWESTGYIDVENHDRIAISGMTVGKLTVYNAMYDEQKNFVSNIDMNKINEQHSLDVGAFKIVDIPDNVKYIRLSTSSGSFRGLKVYSISDVKDQILDDFKQSNLEISNNILTDDLIIKNTYINNEKVTDFSGWDSTDYLYINNFIITNHYNNFNAIYNQNKEYVKTVKFYSNYLNNSVLGRVGVEIAYIKNDTDNTYIRLSNSSAALKGIGIYPVVNENFNNKLKFKLQQ